MFWPAWRLRGRAVVVAVAADPDRGSRARHPEPLTGRHPQDAEAPVCGAVLAGMDLPGRKRYALIADAGQSRGRDGAEALVLAPAGDEEAVTAEVWVLASAGQVDLAPEEDRDSDEVDGKVPDRAEVRGGNLAAARLLNSVEETDPVRAEVRDLAPAEVGQCDLAAARHLASVADVDLAPVPDRTEVRTLGEAGGQVKMDQVEVRDRLTVRALASAADVDSALVPDRTEVRTLAEAGDQVKMVQAEVRDRAAVLAWALADRVAGSVPTDVRMLTCPARSSRNRKFHQKRHRVLRNLSRPKKVLPKRVFLNNGRSRQRTRGLYRIDWYRPQKHAHPLRRQRQWLPMQLAFISYGVGR